MTNVLRGISHTRAAVTSNCSEFERAWRSARDKGIEGRWIGEWRSDVNQHCGELRCALTVAGANHVRAFVHARYAKMLRVCYTVDLRVESIADELHLQGEADLGALAGGVYHYDGTLKAGHLNCN